ncbi:hypothetical protein [Methyloceanibacter methanicus]|uniref:hypothetical protein n=1 Tax=Methyloceanibacter methanicus TaxID=1774968 RepID=UPI001FCDFFC8|nr:hypothetical protein [Methyloceanibacter methanicus]
MKRARADLHIVGLENDAALIGPEALKPQDQVLERGRGAFPADFDCLDMSDSWKGRIAAARYCLASDNGSHRRTSIAERGAALRPGRAIPA